MLNSKIDTARRQVGVLLWGGAGLFLLLTLLTLGHYELFGHDQTPGECAGYAHLPKLTRETAVGDNDKTLRACRESIPKLVVNTKNRNYIKLQQKRLEALSKTVLLTDSNDFVPAHLLFDGEIIKAKIRLKGDWTDHLEDSRAWSLRIVTQGESHIMGRRRFSLQKPELRKNDVEILYNTQLRQMGLMTPRTQLVEVVFNGQDWGLMALEDHFSRELTEVHRRKESVIGRFDESDMWRFRAENPDFGPYDNVYVSDYDSFDQKRIKKSPTLGHYDKLAASLLTAWLEGRLALGAILDVEKYLDFIIVTEAWGGWHAFRWHNLRFYLNPYTLKFEPVPYDNGQRLVDISQYVAYLINVPNDSAHSPRQYPLAELFDLESTVEYLERRIPIIKARLMSGGAFNALKDDSIFLDSILSKYGMEKYVRLNLLKKNYQFLAANHRQYFESKITLPPQDSRPENRLYPSLVRVAVYDNGQISIANKMPFAVSIKAIGISTGFSSQDLSSSGLQFPIRLPATPLGTRPPPLLLDLDVAEKQTLTIRVENPNTSQVLEEKQEKKLFYFDHPRYAQFNPLAQPGVYQPPFVIAEGDVWSIPAGRWHLDHPLIMPRGIALKINAGAQLFMADGSYILSRDKIDILGSSSNKVVISGTKNAPWNGVYLLAANKKSRWQHVMLSDISAFENGLFGLTGAINIYRSTISMQDIALTGVTAEDAINIVNSPFSIDRLNLTDTISDGIDADFSDGTIADSRFENIGGDAIDTSGSKIAIARVEIMSVGDKAISAGEASEIHVNRTTITNVNVAVAAKDYSKAFLDTLTINGAGHAAIMAYSKKSEYGGAFIEARNLNIENSRSDVQSQTGSSVYIDDQLVATKNLNVDYLYSQEAARQ